MITVTNNIEIIGGTLKETNLLNKLLKDAIEKNNYKIKLKRERYYINVLYFSIFITFGLFAIYFIYSPMIIFPETDDVIEIKTKKYLSEIILTNTSVNNMIDNIRIMNDYMTSYKFSYGYPKKEYILREFLISFSKYPIIEHIYQLFLVFYDIASDLHIIFYDIIGGRIDLYVIVRFIWNLIVVALMYIIFYKLSDLIYYFPQNQTQQYKTDNRIVVITLNKNKKIMYMDEFIQYINKLNMN